MKKGITGLDDTKLLVNNFYNKVQQEALLAPIFFEHIPGDWGPHLNKMYQFWNAAVFGKKGYVGNPFARHAHMPLTQTHFDHWLHWFAQTIDAHFEGPMADDAERRAGIMAGNFLNRLTMMGNNTSRTIAWQHRLTNVMKDIQTGKDIEVLVHQFYRKVRSDASLAPVFNAVIGSGWDAHLQKMCDFWGTLLLYTRKYSSDPMPSHMALPLEPAHFERWLYLFNETVDAHFKGEVANTAMTRAKSIATLMQSMKGLSNVASATPQTT